MQPMEFLKAVWPETGLYCIARPHEQGFGYRHFVCDTIEQAAEHVAAIKEDHNVFFCVHTLKERRVYNPTAKTASGKVGKWEVRVQTNTRECKAFFFDLDVGESTERVKKYATQEEAATGLREFCVKNKLPKPAVVSSGGGLHVYWVLEDAIPSAQWKLVAHKLKQLAIHCGLLIDVMRTTDNSSVLRVAGTFNLKKGGKRPVEVYSPFKPVALEQFELKIDNAIEKQGVALTTISGATPAGMPAGPMPDFGDMESNIEAKFADVEPVSIKALAHSCEQVANLLVTTAEHTEPEWYHLLNLVRFVKNAPKYIHAVSKDHPDYNAAAVDHKVDQLERKGVGPTSCAKLAELGGSEICKRCQFYNHVKSPIVAARKEEQADAPVIREEVEGGDTVEFTIPDAPDPYKRRKDGTIAIRVHTAEDKIKYKTILHHDLYPVKRLSNTQQETEQQVWRATLPKVGTRDFRLDSDALYDRRKFASTISNRGIYPAAANIQELQDYMIAYIAKLQRETIADEQFNHLGWIADYSGFIMPDKVYGSNGKNLPVSLTVHAKRSTMYVKQNGTLAEQVKLMEFFNQDKHFATQFMILCAAATPIFFTTDKAGCVINASGKSGSGKSTSLYTAMSMWGHPSKYPLSALESGATTRARYERLVTFSNLPIGVDEITHWKVEEAQQFAMGATQPGPRIRLEKDGTEKATNDADRATLVLSTGNTSLHSLLATNNEAGTAGSMRVLEFYFKKLTTEEKQYGDDFLRALHDNYGHIGPRILAWCVPNIDKVKARVIELQRETDRRGKVAPPERFWSAAIAAALTVGEIAHDLGLLPFDTEKLMNWLIDEQIPLWRGVVADEYDSPLSLLADYLDQINDNMIVTERNKDGSAHQYILKEARGKLLARLEKSERMMWVARSEFRTWCQRRGANDRQVIEELYQKTATGRHDRIVPHKKIRKTLGAGTDLAKAQVWCFGVNLAHQEVSGMAEVEIVSNEPTVKITKPTGRLKVVEDDE